MNVAEPLVQQARARGEATAIIEPGPGRDRRITFGALDDRSAALAAWLRRRGMKPGDRVLVMIGISIDLYVAMTALLRAGLVAVFLDPSAGRGHIRRCCAACPPDALLGPVRAQCLRLLHPGLMRARLLVVPPIFGRRLPAARGPELHACGPQTPGLLTFTSGSTAAPKAAVRTHGLLAAQQAALAEAIDLAPGQMDLATLPVFVLANLAAGVSSVIADADLRRPGHIDPGPVMAQLERHPITRSAGSPAFYQRLLEHAEQTGRTLAPLRRVDLGGAPVFPDLLDRLASRLPEGGPVTVYGSTEAEPIAHLTYAEASAADRAAMRAGAGLLAGPPVPEITLRIAAPDRLERGTMPAEAFEAACGAPSTPGEILVSGAHVLPGYLDPGEDVQTKLRVGRTIWHRTGDAGYLDAAGRLWLLGRAGAVIRDGRGTLYPLAIASAARQVPGVTHAAAVAAGGRRVLAVELAAGTPRGAATGALYERLGDRIDRVEVLARMPVDARHNAKVRYPQLQRMLGSEGDAAAAGDFLGAKHGD